MQWSACTLFLYSSFFIFLFFPQFLPSSLITGWFYSSSTMFIMWCHATGILTSWCIADMVTSDMLLCFSSPQWGFCIHKLKVTLQITHGLVEIFFRPWFIACNSLLNLRDKTTMLDTLFLRLHLPCPSFQLSLLFGLSEAKVTYKGQINCG